MTTNGVWKLQEVRDQILAGAWVTYDDSRDPLPPGELWVWGQNNGGGVLGLGLANTITISSPTQIPGTTWTCISGANDHTLAIKSDGTLWGWGCNTGGFLGLNATINRCSPTQIPGNSWTQTLAISYGSFATKSDGTLWAWGNESTSVFVGQLGLNTNLARSSPAQLPGTQWASLAQGGSIGNGAIKTDGTLWMWGCNHRGQLGQNDLINRSSPVQVPGTQWLSVATGYRATLAIKSDGSLWGWGCGSYGVLGANNIIDRSSPTQIPGTSWKSFSLSYFATGALGLKTDGTLWSWGIGSYCRNTINYSNRSSPLQIPGTTWTKISRKILPFTSHAMKCDNTLWGWGAGASGNQGTIGDNTMGNRDSPVQIPGTSWNFTTGGIRTVFAKKIV